MKKRQAAVLAVIVFVITAVLLVNVSWEKKDKEAKLTESQLGIMCMSSVFSTMEATGDKDAAVEKTSVTSDKTDKKSDGEDSKKKSKKDRKKMLKNGDPLVIIYHTHASESYQPSSEGNFHREGEKDTVREVGDIMEDVMEDAGINVIHDKTMHDRPSYNESYARSLETIQRLMKKYPTAKYVIDLHRDAAAYAGNKGATVKIGKDTVATYSLVVGSACDNYPKLLSYAKTVNSRAESMYPGFGGRIIEKEYKFNQWVCNNHILLEIGNNQNDISEVKNTARYIGKVLAEVIYEKEKN